MIVWIAVAGVLVAGGFLAAMALSSAGFEREVDALAQRMEAGPPSALRDPSTLPPKVRDFAEKSSVSSCPQGPIVMLQKAEMRLEPDGPWIPVEARHQAMASRSSFVWFGRARLAPGLKALVIDALVGGEGRLDARLAGLVPVAKAVGPDATLGEMMRYLGEIPWLPEAILCNSALTWRMLGDDRVEVSADTAAGVARVTLVFDGTGDIVEIEAMRPRDESGTAVVRRWRGNFSNYREIGGARIPFRGEVAWVLPDGPFTYFRGEITSRAEVQTPG